MPYEAINIRSIIEKLKTDYGKRYIHPLASPQVKISLNDLGKIHDIQETVDKIISQLHSFISKAHF